MLASYTSLEFFPFIIVLSVPRTLLPLITTLNFFLLPFLMLISFLKYSLNLSQVLPLTSNLQSLYNVPKIFRYTFLLKVFYFSVYAFHLSHFSETKFLAYKLSLSYQSISLNSYFNMLLLSFHSLSL